MLKTALFLGTVAGLALSVPADAFAQQANSTSQTGTDNKSISTNLNASLTSNKTTNVNVNKSFSNTDTTTTSVALNKTITNTTSVANSFNKTFTLTAWAAVANQTLDAKSVNTDDMNFDGRKANYGSGSNSVNGSAFASYAGILNTGWNTGINGNAQAATNIAAVGTINF